MICPYEQSRKNMVDCQMMPASVVNQDLLMAYSEVPREKFLSDDVKNHAYIDEDLYIGNGRYLMEPMVHAKLIQALKIKADEIVLDIGGATGYSAAIISYLASTVVAIDDNQDFLDIGEKTYATMDLCNIIQTKENLIDGCEHYAPYDVIFINGAVSCVPVKIASQLGVGGRLGAVIRENEFSVGKAVLITRNEDESFSEQILFEANCPYLKGFEPKVEFSL